MHPQALGGHTWMIIPALPLITGQVTYPLCLLFQSFPVCKMKWIRLNSQKISRVWSVCLFNGEPIISLLCAEVSPGPHCSQGKVQPSRGGSADCRGRAAWLSVLIGTARLLLTKVQPQGLGPVFPASGPPLAVAPMSEKLCSALSAGSTLIFLQVCA